MFKNTAPAPEGQPQHQTKLVIRGVDNGSTKYNELAGQFAGQLKQFHVKQQQAFQLAGGKDHKARAKFKGATATYTNMGGQETIVLNVDTPFSEGETFSESKAYWEWAVVEMEVPQITDSSAEFSAFMVPPPTNRVGAAEDRAAPIDYEDPPLAYPDTEFGPLLAEFDPVVIQIPSLRVDLRPYPGGVKFDLYGYIHRVIDHYDPGPAEPPAVHRGTRFTAGIGTTATITTSGGGTLPWPAVGDVSGRSYGVVYRSGTSSARLIEEWPELFGSTFISVGSGSLGGDAYGGSEVIWGTNPMPTGMNEASLVAAAGGVYTETTTMADDGVCYKVHCVGAKTYYRDHTAGNVRVELYGAGATAAQRSWGCEFYDHVYYYPAGHTEVPVYAYPTRTVPLKFAVFDGEPDAHTAHVSNVYSTRWEREALYPERWVFKDLPDQVTIPSIDPPGDTSIGNHFGHVKLGTVIINPLKGKGGIKFTPA